jgi:hypothetical protein
MSMIEHMGLEQGGHRYAKSDQELAGFFTSAVGLSGQGIDPSGVHRPFDSNDGAERQLRAMRWLSSAQSPMAWVDRVAATLGQLTEEHRRTLVLVYTPHAWPSTWLASALATPWGGGSLTSLALAMPGASSSVRGWLLDVDRPQEQERKRRESVCSKLVREAEKLRMDALVAYDALRVTRVEVEGREARERKSARALKSAALLEEELGMDRRIARARLERRMMRGRKAA